MQRVKLNRQTSIKRPKGVFEVFAPGEYNLPDALAEKWTKGDDAPGEKLGAVAPKPAKRGKQKEG